jgi:hypothetical protein
MAIPNEGDVDPRLLANPLKFGESPQEKYARLGSAYTRTGAGVAGSEDQTSSTQNFTKPDGTSVSSLAGVSNGLIGTATGIAATALAQTPVGQAIGKGFAIASLAVETTNRTVDTARRITGTVGSGATVLANAVNKLKENPLEVGNDLLKGIGSVASSLGSFIGGFENSASSGPPYPNVLDGFATYNCLWTLACLEPSQINDPSSYRDNLASLKHIIFASAGRFNSKRTTTKFGAPEFFIDNVTFQSIISPTPATGNTNVTGFNFEIYEPYSMGLFLQSLQVASINAGYPNYLTGTPYLLMLQFAGNTDSGSVLPTNEILTKYFAIQFTKCDMTVDEGGSRYAATAVPYHHMAFTDTVQSSETDVRLTGSTVKEVLSTGPQSLVSYLNKTEEELFKAGQKAIPDQYEITFPAEVSDKSKTLADRFNIGSAKIDPNKIASSVIKGSSSRSEILDVGSNKIGSAPMPFKDSTSGNFVYKDENEVIDTDLGGFTDNAKVTIDPSTREFRFPTGSKIVRIIQDTILVSKYASDAIKVENLDNGMVQWFRIDVHVELLDIDVIRGVRAKKYIFRVLPFLVSGSILKNPSAATPGTNNLKKIIAKRYDYIYTGQNNHILRVDLKFNAMFFTGGLSRPQGTNQTRDKDRNSATDNKEVRISGNAGGTSAQVATAGTNVVQADPTDKRLFKSSPVGDKSVEQEVAEWFQKAFHDASSDLVELEMEVIGDPYFLSDSGINSNYSASPGPTSQIRSDGAMNYEGSEIFAFLVFRTPVEPNLAVSGEGGLYNFSSSGISPFSGIYRVIQAENKWTSGTYTQNLKMLRVLGQEGDFEGLTNIVLGGVPVYGEPYEVPPKTSPVSDTAAEVDSTFVEDPEKTEELLKNVDNLKKTTPGAPTGTTTVIDVRGIQQEAKITAFNRALAEGKSEREADTIANRAGNLAGANALQSTGRNN